MLPDFLKRDLRTEEIDELDEEVDGSEMRGLEVEEVSVDGRGLVEDIFAVLLSVSA